MTRFSVPFLFPGDNLDNPDVIIGKNSFGGVQNFPVPFPSELSEEFSDFSAVQIRKYELWYNTDISFKTYGGCTTFNIDNVGRLILRGGSGCTQTLLVSENGDITHPGNLNTGGNTFIGGNLLVNGTVTASNYFITGGGGSGGGGGGGGDNSLPRLTIITVAPIPPTNASHGNLWWNTIEAQLKIYYEDGDSGQWVDAINTEEPDDETPPTYCAKPSFYDLTFSIPNTLSVGQGAARWYITEPTVVTNVIATVSSAPVGSNLIFDVNKNGESIFVQQTNRPSIPENEFYTFQNVPDTDLLEAGDYLTVDIDQIGSTMPGEHAVVRITVAQPECVYGPGIEALTGDYFILTYNFTSGQDLDTRTGVISPSGFDNIYLGYPGNSPPTAAFLALSGQDPFLTWGGDNRGTGVESVLLDKAKFLQSFPGVNSITLDLRAFWFTMVGSDVTVTATAFKGGEMVPSGYTWVNPTAERIWTNFTSVTKPVSLFTQNLTTTGQRVATATINFATNNITYGE